LVNEIVPPIRQRIRCFDAPSVAMLALHRKPSAHPKRAKNTNIIPNRSLMIPKSKYPFTHEETKTAQIIGVTVTRVQQRKNAIFESRDRWINNQSAASEEVRIVIPIITALAQGRI
jgi:hypothetical protein